MVARFITFDEYFPFKATEYAMGSIVGTHKKEANSVCNVRWCALQAGVRPRSGVLFFNRLQNTGATR